MTVRLEDVTPGAQITGIAGDAAVTAVAATWIGGNAIRLTYRTADGKLDERLLYREHEPRLNAAKLGTAYGFEADATAFKLAAEALRIRMAGRFDPTLAVQPPTWSPFLTRSRLSTASCWTVPRSVSCSPTTLAPARRSWRAYT